MSLASLKTHIPSSPIAWILAARPKTLSASLIPVLLATGWSMQSHSVNLSAVLLPLGFSVCLQIGTNFHNDLCDGLRGADGPDRLGPLRAVASGWISPSSMRKGVWSMMSLGLVLALCMSGTGLWSTPLALLCIAAAIAYTGGDKPLAYRGLGELMSFFFFGWTAFLGTTALQGGSFDGTVWMLSSACGLYATALLAINNVRDLAGDLRAGKHTLAVRWGDRFGRLEVAGALISPLVCASIVGCWGGLLAIVPTGFILASLHRLQGSSWNRALGLSAASYVAFALGIALQWTSELWLTPLL